MLHVALHVQYFRFDKFIWRLLRNNKAGEMTNFEVL